MYSLDDVRAAASPARTRSPRRGRRLCTWWIAVAGLAAVFTVTPLVCSSAAHDRRGRGRADRHDGDRARVDRAAEQQAEQRHQDHREEQRPEERDPAPERHLQLRPGGRDEPAEAHSRYSRPVSCMKTSSRSAPLTDRLLHGVAVGPGPLEHLEHRGLRVLDVDRVVAGAVGVGHAGVGVERGDQAGRRVERDDPGLVHDRDPVAQLLGLLEVVRRQHHRLSLVGVDRADHVPQVVPGLRVEARSWARPGTRSRGRARARARSPAAAAGRRRGALA